MLPPGSTIGRYRVLSALGAGGMGEVYLAQDTELERRIALKILPPEMSQDSGRTRRFVQEAKAASALSHPNVAHIYEIGEAALDGRPIRFIAMEYVEGQPLSSRIAQQSLETPEVIDIAMQVADALDEAHTKGVTHRDIKPSNLMLTPRGQVKVLDFGLAKITRDRPQDTTPDAATEAMTEHGIVLGTVRYMSPEQALGREVDARTDIFSLGVVLFEMATGRLPFEGASAAETLDQLLHAQPQSLSRLHSGAPAELDRIIRKCLEKDRDRRYQSARDLLVDLRNFKRDTDPSASLPPPPAARQRRGRWVAVALPAAVLVLAAVLYIQFRPAGPIDSLAVLPFTNASADPEAEYLSDGITQSLINSLSRLPHLRVVPRTLVAPYKGPLTDPRKAGKELKVRAVLTGRVAQHGDSLTVQTELIDLASESQLWGEQYNRRLADVLTVQEEISKEISAKLRLQLTGEDRERLAKSPTRNTEAYQLYLKGEYYVRKFTKDGVERAADHYRQALDKDPVYALAYAGLADAHLIEAVFVGLPPREVMPKAKDAARKALQLDPTLAAAHREMGMIHLHYDWDWPAAQQEIREALRLDPHDALAHFDHGLYLGAMGRRDESKAAHLRAQELDPLWLEASSILGDATITKEYGPAIEANRKVIEMDPSFFPAHARLGLTCVFQKRFDEAITELAKARKLDEGTGSVGALGFAYGLAGRKTEARKVLEELRELARKRYVPPYDVAAVYLGLGETDRVFEWLERMYQDRSVSMPWINVDPQWDSVRSDPRFQELVRRMKL